MAGTTIESQLTAPERSTTRFILAGVEHDPAIRRLLRENPLRGAISLSFEREPDYFHGAHIAGAEDQTILAFENNRAVCMGRCSISDRYVNGEIRRVGYLSDLRLDSSAQGRFDLLRRGYRFFRELHRGNPADFYFTSVTADNFRSLRFLERGLPGMPIYEPLADFTTLLIPVPGRRRKSVQLEIDGMKIVRCSEKYVPDLVSFLNSHAMRYNLPAAWNTEKIHSLLRHGLVPEDFQLLLDGNRIAGCAALWDQRVFKQTVIRGYNRGLSLARPWWNFSAGLFGMSRLPEAGSALAHGFLSPLAIPADDKQLLPALIKSTLSVAQQRGLGFLTLGFAREDPRLAVVRNQFRCREYASRLFRVHWEGADVARIVLDEKLIFPDIALL